MSLTFLSRIALHSAGTEGGAQNYPQCFNLQVTGSGSDVPAGVLGTELYSPTDPGILVNIYTSLSTYVSSPFLKPKHFLPPIFDFNIQPNQVVPGPTLYSGAVSITQTTSAITATGTPLTGSGAASNAATTAVSAAETSEPSVESAATTALPTAAPSASTGRPSTLRTATRKPASSTTRPATSATPSSGAQSGSTQSVYEQCGGANWTGATACASPAACSSMNPYYSQCVPTGV